MLNLRRKTRRRSSLTDDSPADLRQPGDSLTRRQRLKHAVKQGAKQMLPWFSVLFLAAIIITSLGLLIWFIFYTDVFTVQAVTVVDARDHTQQTTKEIVQTHIDRLPLRQNIFFVQSDAIEANIISDLPQVHTVHVTRKLPGTIKVIIQEKTPALLLLSSTQYYFVDGQGIPYEEARLETLPGTVLPIVKNNTQDSTVTLGVPAVDASFVNFVQQIQEHLPETVDAQVAAIRIPSLAAREVHFTLDNNWELRFDVTRPAAVQLDTLKRVIEQMINADNSNTDSDSANDDQSNTGDVEYIDLRIPNRVYYKLK